MTATNQIKPRGRFIVFEGIDGSGKTTQAKAIADWLPTSGLLPEGAKVVLTREPGATALGQGIRDILLHGKAGSVSPLAELLLFAADRAHHVETVIKPALERGDWVVCDRFTGSTVAYQGYGRGHDLELIGQINKISTQGIEPDLVIWLMIHPDVALQRLAGSDTFEKEGLDFAWRVHSGYVDQHSSKHNWSMNSLSGYFSANDVTSAAILQIESHFR